MYVNYNNNTCFFFFLSKLARLTMSRAGGAAGLAHAVVTQLRVLQPTLSHRHPTVLQFPQVTKPILLDGGCITAQQGFGVHEQPFTSLLSNVTCHCNTWNTQC
jgi:hypothetical protein